MAGANRCYVAFRKILEGISEFLCTIFRPQNELDEAAKNTAEVTEHIAYHLVWLVDYSCTLSNIDTMFSISMIVKFSQRGSGQEHLGHCFTK